MNPIRVRESLTCQLASLSVQKARRLSRRGEVISHKRNGITLTDAKSPALQLAPMGFYEERPPRHGHRTPSELAEDEMFSAVHGDFCGMPTPPEKARTDGTIACVPILGVALLPWADAHPFAAVSGKPFYQAPRIVPATAGKLSSDRK